METMKAILVGILVIVVLAVLGTGVAWLVQGNDFVLYKYFGPKMEKVRYEVYTNTPSYIQGTIADLQDLQRDYNKAVKGKDDEGKKNIAGMIVMRSGTITDDKLPSDLLSFIRDVRREQAGG